MPTNLNNTKPTLCFPGNGKSCFACCPPIRPAGYEHIQYKNIVKRMLFENTSEYHTKGKGIFPITGFSCWALGYLDKDCGLVGCLLHPARNEGVDLRFRVDYGKKCERESCPEAKVFLELGIREGLFWLHLSDDLDSFSYSSRKLNPLFKMTGWGADLLNLVAVHEKGRVMTRESFFRSYPFFFNQASPRANAYLLSQLVTEDNVHVLKTESFSARFETFSQHLASQLKRVLPPGNEAPYTHLLGFDNRFLDYLRLSVGISRVNREEAVRLKDFVDEALLEFKVQHGTS
jgi:hypothetical protein